VAFKLAELFVPITGTASGLHSTLAGVSRTLAGFNRGIGSALTKAMGFAVGPALVGMAAAGAGIAKAVSNASDLNESLSKAGVVFGDSAGRVIGDAQRMADAFGVPKQQFVDAASAIGLIGKASGLTQSAAANLGSEFASLAGDVSSFYNVDLQSALDAIRSGLVGEAEPLRAFGVLLNEDAVKAEAARLGLARLGAELTEGQKVQARASLITKGLSDAQGDLARTANSTSNRAREAWGRLGNAMTDVGTVIEPVWNRILNAGVEALSGLNGWIQSNLDMFRGWMSEVQGVLDVVGVLWRNWGTALEITGLKGMEMLINLGEVINWLPSVAGEALGWLADNWPQVIYDTFSAAYTIVENTLTNIRNLFDAVFSYIMDPSQGFHFDFTPLLDGFKATMDELPDVAMPALTSLQDRIDAASAKMIGAEAERAAKMAAIAGGAAPAKAGQAGGAAAVAGKTRKTDTSDAEEYARKLQASILDGGNSPAKQQLDVQKQQLVEARATRELIAKGQARQPVLNPAVAM
jgi:hypothetical protein